MTGSQRGTRRPAAVRLAPLALLALLGRPGWGEQPTQAPLDSSVREEVEVQLVEFKILVTDRRGSPITDLGPDEITVIEGGEPQKLAFLETVSGQRASPTARETAPPPATVYTADGAWSQSTTEDFPPAPAVRRIVLAFDVRNSKRNARERWQQSALQWLREEMKSGDEVAIVVFRSFPEWVLSFTGDRAILESTLANLSLGAGTPDRDRGREMSRLVDDIRSMCIDPGRARRSRRDASEHYERSSSNFDELSCSFNASRNYVQQWHVEAQETTETLRTLAGQLAAVPGRKVVLLFSDGLVADASTMAANAMLAVLGSQKVDLPSVVWRFRKDVLTDLNQLHHAARAADVSFFTFDTRRGQDYGFEGQLEQGQHLSLQSMGVNPWSEIQNETRQSLHSLAKETGGRSFHGIKDLGGKVAAAADSYFGLYSVGFYRSDPDAPARRVQVRIARKRLRVDYTDRISLSRHRSQAIPLDLVVGSPEPGGDGSLQAVPVRLWVEADSLPLRRGAGGRGVQLGVHLQAIGRDGSIAAERLDLVTVVLDREERQNARGKRYEHVSQLLLPDGAYRIRGRISDDRQKILADRTIDLELRPGQVLPAGVSPAAASN